MKKLIAMLLVLMVVFSCTFVVTAQDSPVLTSATDIAQDDTKDSIDKDIDESSTQDEKDAVVEDAIQIEEETFLIEDEKAFIEQFDESNLTNDTFIEKSFALFKYFANRELYYKRVLDRIDIIGNMINADVKKQAIDAFEKKYLDQKEQDSKVYNRLVRVLDYYKLHKSEFSQETKVYFKKVLVPLWNKYFDQRKIISAVYKKILNIKELGSAAENQDFIQQARDKALKNDLSGALDLYKKALISGLSGIEIYKETAIIMKKIEGDGPKVIVKGKLPQFDVKPMIKNGRTLVPFRAIANALDAEVNWDGATSTVTVKKSDKIVTLKIGDVNAYVDGKLTVLDVPPIIEAGRTLIPARFVSEALDANVNYDPATQLVKIDDSFGDNSKDIDKKTVQDSGLITQQDLSTSAQTEDKAVSNISQLDNSQVEDQIDAMDTIIIEQAPEPGPEPES